MSKIRRPRGALASFLLLPSVLNLLGLAARSDGVEEAPIHPTAAESREPARPSPFVKPSDEPEGTAGAPAAAAPSPGPTDVPAAVPVPAPSAAPAPVPPQPKEPTGSGDGSLPPIPAKPPAPPPSGLQPLTPPAATGPAIPIPTTPVTDWGSGPRGDREPAGKAVYGGVLGTVVDAVTKKPVENVEVSIPELDLRALTGPDGLFMIRGIRVREQAYELLMDAPNYEKNFGELKIEAKGTHQREFELTPMGW